ncbi:MAG: SMC-Scp complex subunit ScpB [Oscillospiraceae bacterium]|jgi:segregation and condensation protein B|nr:SMC-Scp complex subunit ScpB [Oscillospiraceae bacterium]
MDHTTIEAAIEGILFASGEPVTIARLAAALDTGPREIEEAAEALSGRYRFERRGFRLVRLDKSLQMTTAPELADLIRKTLEERKPPPMSRAALEVLSLAAYYQPVTRAQIERARGVESGATLAGLVDKGLLAEAGRLDVPGRPIQYKTTPAFLRAFGLTSLDELPDTELDGQLTME